jgi:hypothetical protein
MLFPNRVPSGNPAATPPCCSRIHAPRAAGPSSGRARDTGRAPARRLAGVRWRGWPGVRGGPVVGTRWAASLRPPTASGLTGWTRGRSARSGWLPVAFAALSRDWSLIDSGKLPEAIRPPPRRRTSSDAWVAFPHHVARLSFAPSCRSPSRPCRGLGLSPVQAICLNGEALFRALIASGKLPERVFSAIRRLRKSLRAFARSRTAASTLSVTNCRKAASLAPISSAKSSKC